MAIHVQSVPVELHDDKTTLTVYSYNGKSGRHYGAFQQGFMKVCNQMLFDDANYKKTDPDTEFNMVVLFAVMK